MVFVALSSFVGVYFHIYNSMADIWLENPSLPFNNALWPVIKGGAPLMAPSVLFLAGILGIAATYKHPKLKAVNKSKD